MAEHVKFADWSPGALSRTSRNQSVEAQERPEFAGQFVLHRKDQESLRSLPGEKTVKAFVERLVRSGTSLAGADFDRLAEALEHSGASGQLDSRGRILLHEAVLPNADLRDIKASRVDLYFANLRSSWLDGAQMPGACMVQAEMQGVRARRADFEGADMRGSVFEPDKAPPSAPPASIPFGAKDDEGLRQNRFLAEGINLRNADLTSVILHKAQLSGADLRGAKINDSRIEDCNLDAARMDGTDFTRSVVTGCSLVSETVHQAKTNHAVMRNNSYARLAGIKTALKSPSRLFHLGKQEREQRALMPKEMRRDYDASVAVSMIMAAALPVLTTAFGVEDKLADGVANAARAMGHAGGPFLHAGAHVAAVHAPHLLADAVNLMHAAASSPAMADVVHWAGIHAGSLAPMAPAAALGIGGMWVLHKLVGGVMEPVVRTALEKGNEALGFLRERKPGQALGCLVGWGTSTPCLRKAISHDGGQDVLYASSGDTLVVVAEHSRLADILRAAGLADGILPDSIVTVRRDSATGWPEDAAPQEVCILPGNRGTTATWFDGDGVPVRTVIYSPDGSPAAARGADGMLYPASGETEPFFVQVREPVAEFMEGLVHTVAPYDGRTHVARIGSDGTIMIRRAEDGVVDNPNGPAVVSSEGSVRNFVEGRPVQTGRIPGKPEPEPSSGLRHA